MPNIFGAGLVTIMPLSNFGGDHYGEGIGGGNPDGGGSTSSDPEGTTPPDPTMPFFLPPPGDGPGEM